MKKLTACKQFAFCCAILLAAQARAQLEGSLFTSPEERVYLDYLRSEFLRNNAEDDFNIEEADIPEIPDATTATPAGPVEYSFGGAMTGRDGVRVWLNGRLLGEAQLPEGFSVVQSGRSFSLRIMNDGRTYMLAPGQTVDLTAGTVVENFERSQTESTPNEVPAPPPDTNENVSAAGGSAQSRAEIPLAVSAANEDLVLTTTDSNESAVGDEVAAEPAAEQEMTPDQRTSVMVDALSRMTPEEMGALAEALQRMREQDADQP